MNLPEIRIFYSWLLANGVSKQIQELHPDWTHDDPKTLETYTDNYRQEWIKYEAPILDALTEALGVNFYKPVIDVACAPNIMPLSDPLVISFQAYPDQFVDVLTHELSHVLLTDNTTYSMHSSEQSIDLQQRWAKLFGAQQNFNTLVHIPVHALCKHVYLDILQEPQRLERDMQDTKSNAPYKAAWDYVNDTDYKKILADLKFDFGAIK